MTIPNIDRIKSLLELAQHEGTEENEARNAAFQAVRLMAKHGFTVAKPWDLLQELQDPAPIPTRTVVDRGHSYVSQPANPGDRRGIRSKYSGACAVCEQRHKEGDLIWWAQGKPVICSGCFNAGA